jgi:hypothetical protein
MAGCLFQNQQIWLNRIMGNTMVDNNVLLCYHYNSAVNLAAHFLT